MAKLIVSPCRDIIGILLDMHSDLILESIESEDPRHKQIAAATVAQVHYLIHLVLLNPDKKCEYHLNSEQLIDLNMGITLIEKK